MYKQQTIETKYSIRIELIILPTFKELSKEKFKNVQIDNKNYRYRKHILYFANK